MTDRNAEPPAAGTPPGGAPSADEPRLGRLSRRRALKWLIRLGYGAFAVAFALPALAIRSLTQVTKAVAPGDVLVLSATTPGANVGSPLKAADLAEGTGVQVFPRDKSDNQDNLIEVVRVAAGEGADGLVAYSAICTHLGCAVYAQLNDDGHITCPCHASVFDPANGAEVIGGPAPRPLPSLPIGVDGEGNVVVDGDFSGPIGPD
jgi:rieske iron-sulfur protein